MTPKGKLIVLEGLDGSGKTVQFELLKKYLDEHGFLTATVDFPEYSSFYGKLVGRYLNKEFGDVYEVSPYLSSLLYAGDRKDAAKRLWEWINQGYVVLANRYVGANMAYHSVKLPQADRLAFFDWVEKLEYEGLQPIPSENLVIYFNSDVTIAQKMVDRKAARSYTDQRRDIHERNSNFLEEVGRVYLHLSESKPGWEKIDVIDPSTGQMYPPKTIHSAVLSALKEHNIL